MINYFTYDDIPSTDFGVYISGHDTFDSPYRAYDMFSVPGKNGDDLGIEKRLQNVTLIYDAFICRDFQPNAAALRNFLISRYGYKRLVDTYHPDEFRLAVVGAPLDFATTPDNKAASFQLVFNCKPQRYLFSGEQTIAFTADGSITNPTYFASKPMIRIYGNGQVGIGSFSVTTSGATEYTDLDCEVMEAFEGAVSRNKDITLDGYDFPELVPGENTIQLGEGITRVEITPRWFTV